MMHGEVVCPSCQNRLKVPVSAGGKQAVCAVCQTVFGISNADTHLRDNFQHTEQPNPFAAANMQSATVRRLTPHRGGIVLALSLLGWFFCPVFSVIAWLMGRSDLRRMDRGSMDNSGRTVTQAGTIVAIVNCVMILLGLVAMMIFVLVGGILSVSV